MSVDRLHSTGEKFPRLQEDGPKLIRAEGQDQAEEEED